MFRIKICGVTSVADASLVREAAADAIGLNFAPVSPRCISPGLGRQIAQSVRGGLAIVGVFVNQPIDEVNQIADQVGLDFVQLHGDETAEACAAVVRPAIKAVAFGGRGMAPAADFCQASQCTAKPVAGLLIDASVVGQRGGTGTVLDWHRVGLERVAVGNTRWLLAGGLSPANVAEAVRQARPFGVDVASGVESSVGRKDRQRMMAFVESARAAFRG